MSTVDKHSCFFPSSSLFSSPSYLVMPYMDMDLSKVKGVLSEDKIQFLVYQILKGLKVGWVGDL